MQLHSSKPKQKVRSEGKAGQDLSFAFEAIGTHWTIEIFDSKRSNIIEKIKKRIDVFDKNYSRFRADSLVTKMSQKAGKYLLPSDARPMLDLYQKLYELSKGKVTPLIGQVLSDAGYDAQYSFKPKEISKPLTWEESLGYNFPYLNVKKQVLLDFGALGKGYLIDIIAGLLKKAGSQDFVINAGGDIYCSGSDAIQIALESPDDSSQAVGIATISKGAICGSAGHKRSWAGYTHIMDPHFPKRPTRYKAVWVVANNTMLADCLTTALYFCEKEDLLKHFKFEYAIIDKDNSLDYSEYFPAEFFLGERA